MDGTASLIRRLEQQRSETQMQMAHLRATLAGIDAQLRELRETARVPKNVAELPLTDAIVSILRTGGGEMTPSTVRQRLAEGGRDEMLNKVTATLAYLVNRNTVIKVGRGLYSYS